MIDAALIAALALPLAALTLPAFSWGELAQSTVLWFVAVPVSMVVVAVPLMLREGRHSGQTLGKQITGIRVVSSQHGRLILGSAVVRELLLKSILLSGPSAALVFLPALFNRVWLILDPERRGIHDRTARTRVIRTREAPS